MKLAHGLRDDDGITFVELSVASLVIGVIGALMLSMFMMVARTERITAADTESLTSLRISRTRVERDIRQADRIEDDSTTDTLHLWVDDNADGTVDPNEDITWFFEADPAGGFRLVRIDADGNRTVAGGGLLDPATADYDPFTDAGSAPSSSSQIVTVTLGAENADGQREQVSTDVRLRNF